MSDDEAYKLTVKGFLAVETGLMGAIDPVWDKLTEFVKREAAKNGMKEGAPCLVLEGGGHCITARTKQKEGE